MKNIVYSSARPTPAFRDLIKENSKSRARPLSIKSSAGCGSEVRYQSLSTTPTSVQESFQKNFKPETSGQEGAEAFRNQCKQLKQELKEKESIITTLKEDNEHLRTLNLGYVQSINNVIHQKIETIEKIIINKEVFSSTFQSDAKLVIQRLESNLRKVESQLRSFVQHCRVMEADIEIYRRKIADADIIVQGLKSTGENSIDNLVTKLSNNDEYIKQLEIDNRSLQYENCLASEKIREQNLKYGDIEQNYEECQQQYRELVLKHNRILSEAEDKKNLDGKIIHNLKCQNDFNENELRNLQRNIQDKDEEKIEAYIKMAELTQINDTLRSTFTKFKRHSIGANVQFKKF